MNADKRRSDKRPSICPTCGSQRIGPVRRTVTRRHNGEKYTVPDLEFLECSNCGERLYGREAMNKIEAVSPAHEKRRPADR
jgi:YgiT-type zinc finger domain-containing protein